MKKLMCSAFLLLSVNAFAGPEDHMYDSCYTANKNVPSSMFSTLCFADVVLNLSKSTLDFSGYAMTMPNQMATESLYRKTEDSYFYVAKKNIVNKWESGCGEGLKVDLVVTGEADFNGTIDPKSLSVIALIEETNDTCHSHSQESVIEYKLSK